jgi:serine/threonine protein kinase
MTCRGYLPPEYIERQIITKEFDIFSLGVIIAKLMAGREDYFKIDSMPENKFIKHVSNRKDLHISFDFHFWKIMFDLYAIKL